MIFDLTANTNRRKLMVLDPSYPKDANVTVIKGNTTSATFSVVITEPGSPDEYTYQWYVNGSAVSGATEQSYTRTGLSASATYTVYCEVTNKAGTVKSREATLEVIQYYTPTLSTSYPQNASVTLGNSVTAKVSVSTAGNPASYTYQWYKNGTAVSGATSSSYTFTPTAVGTTTVYCKVTNAAGTVTSRTATITATVIYLYNAGDQCEDVTGGWGVWHTDDGEATLNSTYIRVRDGSGYGACCSKNKINLSAYSKLCFDISGSTPVNEYGTGGVGVMSTNASTAERSVTWLAVNSSITSTRSTISVDISSVNSGYIAAWSSFINVYIYKIWLEY